MMSSFSLSSELSNALLRWIAQHGQVKLINQPAVKSTIEPTIKTTFNAHQYTIQTDCNQVNDILNDIQSKPIAIAVITCIQVFIGHLAMYASYFNP